MTHRLPPPADRPESRRDSTTRPPRSRSRANGAPYPGAPAPARSRKDSAGPRRTTVARTSSRVRSTASTPATVWATGPEPIDPAATWPIPIVEAITASFSSPGARVLLALWPSPASDVSQSARHLPDGQASTMLSSELAAARGAVEGLGRTPSVARLISGQALPGVSSQPFWADFVTDSPSTATALVSPTAAVPDTPTAEGYATVRDPALEPADLIITVLPPERSQDGSVDAVALTAADLLAFGGILAVYTHSDWYGERLVDPSGPMVAAAQSADLLYLQHVVTLHAAIRDGNLQPLPNNGERARHASAAVRANARRLPTPHVRTHGDVLVFAQAHEPNLPNVDSSPKPDTAQGDLR